MAIELLEHNIEVRVYEPAPVPGWEYLTLASKLFLSRHAGVRQFIRAKNTTTTDMHEWLVGRTDPHGGETPDVSELALGRSDQAVAEDDSSLTDEVDRASVTSSAREGATLRVQTFVDKDVGNVDAPAGESLSEVGLYAGGYFLNHATLTNDIDKTSNKTATIDVLLTFDAA